ncbi:hypothetical protein LCGC14_0758300 [marine sediment metagenome]|uniref:Uncharacterized protein n=1 Tax=marine sediment metagenome TaxID=412755 RepID=A0A0F9T920_9ZZZZ
MKCPMLTMYAITYKPPEVYEDRDCQEGDCAWWIPQGNVCAITSIAIDIHEVKNSDQR